MRQDIRIAFLGKLNAIQRPKSLSFQSMRYLTFNVPDCVQWCIIQGALIYDEGQQPPVPLLIVCQGQVHHPPPFTPVIKSTNHPHCTCTPDKQIWGNIWLEAGLNIKGAKTRKKQARNVRGYCVVIFKDVRHWVESGLRRSEAGKCCTFSRGDWLIVQKDNFYILDFSTS